MGEVRKQSKKRSFNSFKYLLAWQFSSREEMLVSSFLQSFTGGHLSLRVRQRGAGISDTGHYV